jgi:hypothetical protein
MVMTPDSWQVTLRTWMLVLLPLTPMQSWKGQFKMENSGVTRDSTYITTRDGPVCDGDILRVPGIRTVRILRALTVLRVGFHVEVRHGHVLRVRNKGMPELRHAPNSTVSSHFTFPPKPFPQDNNNKSKQNKQQGIKKK